MSPGFGGSPPFPQAAARALGDAQLRANLRRATGTIRAKRARVMAELDDLEQLRDAAAAIKDEALSDLGRLLEQVEQRVTEAGGHVHFAADAAEANDIVVRLARASGAHQVVKVKSMTTAETGLNEALAGAGVQAVETDLAELIVQLGDDLPSHIVVPALHRNRAEIRDIFARRMGERGLAAPEDLGDTPAELAGAARAHLRQRFLEAEVAISGANFVVAETGSVVVVESEGNGRMCVTLPRTLITVAGIDKVVPRFTDLEVFLALLARSATGERLSPYTSVWTGATPGNGPSEFHLVLVDNGRSRALADPVGRQALRCIRCAACLNVCPVYERAGGHAYGSVYPGPIGAVLTPQLDAVATGAVEKALPFASSLCGACAEVCPVRIDIPRLLVHLRGMVVDAGRGSGPEALGMAGAAWAMSSPARLARAQALVARLGRLVGRGGALAGLPGPLGHWARARDLPPLPAQSFRQWWAAERGEAGAPTPPPASSAPPGASVRDVLGWLRRTTRGPGGGGAPGRGREGVLASVRSSLGSAPYPAARVPRAYRRDGGAPAGGDDLVELFVRRVSDYKATVRLVGEGEVAAAVADALARSGSRRVVVPADLPRRWLPGRVPGHGPDGDGPDGDGRAGDGGAGVGAAGEPAGAVLEVVADDGRLGPAELDAVDATVSGCALAVAATGTVVLDSGPAQGRRALSLVPDHLVVVVAQDQVVADLPQAVARLAPRSAQTWISGPSATSDIELQRVEGVHGPRVLDVVVVARARP